jgi:hypothetical protein
MPMTLDVKAAASPIHTAGCNVLRGLRAIAGAPSGLLAAGLAVAAAGIRRIERLPVRRLLTVLSCVCIGSGIRRLYNC